MMIEKGKKMYMVIKIKMIFVIIITMMTGDSDTVVAGR